MSAVAVRLNGVVVATRFDIFPNTENPCPVVRGFFMS
jgi:hypothetical protein